MEIRNEEPGFYPGEERAATFFTLVSGKTLNGTDAIPKVYSGVINRVAIVRLRWNN